MGPLPPETKKNPQWGSKNPVIAWLMTAKLTASHRWRSFMGAVFLLSSQVQKCCNPRHYRRAFSSLVMSSNPGRPSRANILFVLAGRFHRPHRSHECCNGRLLADCIGCVVCFVGTSYQRFSQRLFLPFTQSRFLYPGHHLVRSSAQNKNLPVGGRHGRRSG